MPVNVTHKLNLQQLQFFLTSPQGGVMKDMLRRGLKVESAAKMNLASDPRRINTGRLRSSIQTTTLMRGMQPVVRVGTNVKYARWVHDGTGIYGPFSTVIRPKHKKVMRWKGKGGYVYAKYTLGMRPNPFLRKALKAAVG